MNSKLITGSLAGVAALALAAGGTTMAAWSDFGVESTSAGAGILKLNVSTRDGAGSTIKPFSLAPGQNKFQEFYLASADADNVPVGRLTAKIQNLVDTEDGGPACTTKSENEAEGGGGCGTKGELSQEARVQILVSDPMPGASSCASTGIYKSTTPSGVGTLADRAGTTFSLGDLKAGEGICVRMEMSLLDSATNRTQGDDVSFDWRFDLEQVLS